MASLIELTLNNRLTQLDTTKNVKPDKPKGHLVDTPLYKVPFEYVGDLAKDTYGVVKGLRGKANDHELGKQNDIGMKLGSLAIAAYLMSFRPSNITKLMEVVGVGSFFTSMALWPKLAIALPLKMRTGVDIQQKYVDSYGRKKYFYQDPQYLAWDLYSKEQIDKMGEKMGVPYDVPNRDEVIKEKARKMAVQGNTLWMATAGFATPIATGLICSGLEPIVEDLRQKYALKHSQRIMDSQAWFNASMAAPKAKVKEFDSYITETMGSKIKDTKKLVSLLNWGRSQHISPLMDKSIEKDLEKLLSNAQNNVDLQYIEDLYNKFSSTLAKAGISKSKIEEYFKNAGLFGEQKTFIVRYQALKPNSEALDLADATKEILDELIDKKAKKATAVSLKSEIGKDSIENFVKDFNRKILDEETADKLKKVFNELSNYFNREGKLVQWENARNANSADSMRAHSWKKVTNEIFSAMGFSSKEIEEMSLEGSKTMKIFDDKVQELVQNPTRYQKAVKRIAQKIAEFDAVTGSETRAQYRDYVDRLCDLSQKSLKELGFDTTSSYIGGRPFIYNDNGVILNKMEALSGSLRNLKKVNFDEAILSERASMYRILQILDLNKRIADGTLEGQFNVISKEFPALFNPNFVAVEDTAKRTISKYGLNMHEAKLNKGMEKVGQNAYKTVMRLLYGHLPERYIKDATLDLISKSTSGEETIKYANGFLKAAQEKGIEAGYKVITDAGFDKIEISRLRTGMHPETIEALFDAGKKSGVDLVDNMKVYMQTFIENVVNTRQDGALRNHNLCGYDLTGSMKELAGSASNSLKNALVGIYPDKLLRDAANEISNRGKWLRKFGLGGAALLTGTVLATMFFGHLPKKEMYMKDGNK